MTSSTQEILCGHELWSANGHWKCCKRHGHKGWHEETFRTRDGYVERTNWGDDGKAIWASEDEERRKASS